MMMIWRIGWIRPFLLNNPGAIHPIIQNHPSQNSKHGKELNTFSPQTEATTFAFSSVFILFLCTQSNNQSSSEASFLVKQTFLGYNLHGL